MRLKCALLFLFLFFLSETSEARDIRVMLSNSKKYQVASDSAMTVVDAAKKSYSIGKSETFNVSGGSITIAGKKVPLPVTIESKGLFRFKGYKYRGVLRISNGGDLVNVLDIEDYVRGVIKAESNSNWPIEYLKVQAIVSRTFGLRESISASGREYDVVDSTSSQVYHGASAESARTDRAVKETSGKVLAHGNDLAGTYFHSDSGGATANISDVWGKDIPYLRARKEPVLYRSPNSTWEKRLSAAELSRSLRKVTPNVGTITEIKIVNTDSFGRAVELQITGTSSSARIKASDFRMAIGPNIIKSTFFTAAGNPAPTKTQEKPKPKTSAAAVNKSEVDFNSPLTLAEEMEMTELIKSGRFSGKEMMEILTKPEKRKEYLYKILGEMDDTTTSPVKPSNPDDYLPPAIQSGKTIPFENGNFIFRGRGWGHGVGLSQYGGMALAKAGWNAEKILTHYFPGTTVKTAK